MNRVPNHSSNKIWNILASEFWILKNLEHVLGDQLILVYTKLLFDEMLINFEPTFLNSEMLSWGHLFELHVFLS